MCRTANGILRRGELERVLALELRVLPAAAQRQVRAVRVGVVADVEVRTGLRRREDELAADRAVAQHDGREHERESEGESGDLDPATRPGRGAETEQRPRRERRCEQHALLAREHERAECRAGSDPARERRLLADERQREQEQRHPQESDAGLLDAAVEEDRRRIRRGQHANRDARAASEESSPRDRQDPAGDSANGDLHEPHVPQVVADDDAREAEEVGVERRLVEDLRAGPVAGDERVRPAPVRIAVDDDAVEHRTGARLQQVDVAQREGEHRHGARQAEIETDARRPVRALLVLHAPRSYAMAGSSPECPSRPERSALLR